MIAFFVDSIITPPDPDGCASRLLSDNLDLIFTDIIGVERLADASGLHESRYRSAEHHHHHHHHHHHYYHYFFYVGRLTLIVKTFCCEDKVLKRYAAFLLLTVFGLTSNLSGNRDT